MERELITGVIKQSLTRMRDVEYIDLDFPEPDISEHTVRVALRADPDMEKTECGVWDGYPKVEDYKRINRTTGSIQVCTIVKYSSGLQVKFKEKLSRDDALMKALDILIDDTTNSLTQLSEKLSEAPGD